MPLVVLNITPATSNSSYTSATFSASCIILREIRTLLWNTTRLSQLISNAKMSRSAPSAPFFYPSSLGLRLMHASHPPSRRCPLAFSHPPAILCPSPCCPLAFSYPPLFPTCTLPPCIAPAPVSSDNLQHGGIPSLCKVHGDFLTRCKN